MCVVTIFEQVHVNELLGNNLPNYQKKLPLKGQLAKKKKVNKKSLAKIILILLKLCLYLHRDPK